MNIRIILLRVLLSWWLIPVLWCYFPIVYLLLGREYAIDFARDFTRVLWSGAYDN